MRPPLEGLTARGQDAYISGVPHRIGWFEKALAHMAARPGTVFWQGRQIMDWYSAATES